MLSYNEYKIKGRPIAVHKIDNKSKLIYLYTDINEINKIKGELPNDISILSEDDIRKGKRLSFKEYDKILYNVKNGAYSTNKKINAGVEKAKQIIENKKGNEISINVGIIEIVPNIDSRECIYISGPSGSGKTYFCNSYITKYNTLFPNNNIYVFSKIGSDMSLTNKNIKKIELNEDIIKDPIDVEELNNSLVLFDDTDTIRDNKIAKEIDNLKDDILSTGRHESTYTLITSHQIMNYKRTRLIIAESHAVVFFLNTGSSYHIRRFLNVYCGCDKQTILKILNLRSRWCFIYLRAPRYVVCESSIFLLT